MPLFFGDFLASTADWQGEERSLYLTLLGYQWSLGSLPADLVRIRKLVDWDREMFDRCWPVVSAKFVEREGRLVNGRLEKHREKVHELSDKRSATGRRGAESKWGRTSGDPSKTPAQLRSERLAAARRIASHTTEEWLALVEACGNKCVCCGTPAADLNGGSLCKDHITPIYSGGSDGLENIQPMCRNCNSSKGSDAHDYRPDGWRESVAKRMANGWQNACHLIQSNLIEEKKEELPVPSGDVVRVFDHWKTVHGKARSKLDDKRRKLIRAALKNYSADDLCRCIDGYKRSAWHQGKNDRATVYDDIELFLRDAKQIDAGLKHAEQGATPQW
jgi:5-methylcytosine-specific restriction endonuclease McrA